MKPLNEEFIYELGRHITQKDRKVKYYIFLSQSLGEETIVSQKEIDRIESELKKDKNYKNDVSKQKYIAKLRGVDEILTRYGFTRIEKTNPPVWGLCISVTDKERMGLTKNTKDDITKYRAKLVNCLKELRQFESIPPTFTEKYTPQDREKEAEESVEKMLNILRDTIIKERDYKKKGKRFRAGKEITQLDIAQESFDKCRNSIIAELLEKLQNNDAQSYIANIMKYKGRLKIDEFRGHELSTLNKLLVLKQCPDAKLVKSRSRWNELNRDIKPNAQRIYLIRPFNYTPDKELKDKLRRQGLQNMGINANEPLNYNNKQELEIFTANDQEKFRKNPIFRPYIGFDYSQTEQIKGMPVLIDDSHFYTKQELNPQHNGKVSSSFYLIISLASWLNNIGIDFTLNQAIDKREKALAYMSDGKITMGDTFLNTNADTLSVFLHETAHAIMHDGNLSDRRDDAKSLYKPSDDKNIKEQEAELVSWSVMKYFGFNIEKSLVYTQHYGLTKENVLDVLDHVAATANYIVLGIKKYYNPYRNNSSNNMKNASLILQKFGLLDYINNDPNGEKEQEEQEMVTTGNSNNNDETQTEKGGIKESILREGAIFTVDNLASALGITKLVQQAKKDEMYNNNSENMVENNKEQFYENYKRFFGKRVDL